MQTLYPTGIDHAKKASSVRLPAMELPKTSSGQVLGTDTAAFVKVMENKKLYANATTPGEILGVKRVDRLQKRQKALERRRRLEGLCAGDDALLGDLDV